MSESLFRELGFSEKGSKIYLLLAQAGKSTAQRLAKRAQIPRTTAYSVLNTLLEKGLVAQEQRSGTTFFVVNKPSAILRGVEAEAAKVKKKETLARELIERIHPFFKTQLFSVPKIKFFEGRPGVENMLYDHCQEWQESIHHTDSAWWGVQDHSFALQYDDWQKHYFAVKSPSIEMCLFCSKLDVAQEAKRKISAREIQVVPEGFDGSNP